MAWPITYEFVRKLLDSVGGIAAVVAVWEFLNHLWSNVVTHLPRRAVLGDLAKNDVPCQIFVVHLYTPAGDNKYRVAVPDYFPPKTTGLEDCRINTPRVIATADAIAVADVLNAVGQAGRYDRLEIVDPVTHWQNWDSTVVCVGGSFKSDEVFRKCKGLPVVFNGGFFKIVAENRLLSAVDNQDFGLICKTSNPENHRDIWLLIGLGSARGQSRRAFICGTISSGLELFSESLRFRWSCELR